ncbi:MAG TPA: glycosyltransferase [Longimicrobiaceae bacterium]|nr:glycosyltransferase [Longimicrobiaceae bacterium]
MLTVLSVAYAFAGVGAGAVGGAEQVLFQLDAALVRAGHRSLVVAQEGSEVAGELVATPGHEGAITEQAQRVPWARHRAAIRDALERHPVDLVHLHGIDFPEYLPPPGVPVLATLHLPPSWYPAEVFRTARRDTWLHCVSEAQQRACPPSAALLPHIANGVPVDRLAARHARRSFAVALGRVCPEKGFHHALEAARGAGVPLLIGGKVFPYEEHERYFAREVRPRLDRSRRFLGPLDFARKRRCLNAAHCLLVPSRAPETSSLVAMKGLACGTPVIAFRSGALPEIVEHGRTGFLVDDVREMADAIPAVDTLDREECRAAARERFSLQAMTDRYLELYTRVSAGTVGGRGAEGARADAA